MICMTTILMILTVASEHEHVSDGEVITYLLSAFHLHISILLHSFLSLSRTVPCCCCHTLTPRSLGSPANAADTTLLLPLT